MHTNSTHEHDHDTDSEKTLGEGAQCQCLAAARIPSTFGGTHRAHLYSNTLDGEQHMALVFGDIFSESLEAVREDETQESRMQRGASPHPRRTQLRKPPLVRIHSCCFTGETLGSSRCDCAEQLQSSLRLMSKEECGVVLYLKQEGRGIGLLDKLLAYNLIDLGHDTLSANLALGHPADARDYQIAQLILKDLHITELRLLTNNPDKLASLAKHFKVEHVSMVPQAWTHPDTAELQDRDGYLVTKIQQMGHILSVPAQVMERVNSASALSNTSSEHISEPEPSRKQSSLVP